MGSNRRIGRVDKGIGGLGDMEGRDRNHVGVYGSCVEGYGGEKNEKNGDTERREAERCPGGYGVCKMRKGGTEGTLANMTLA